MARGTTLRNVRVAEDLWASARTLADERSESLSDVMRLALEQYVAGEFMLPPRPTPASSEAH